MQQVEQFFRKCQTLLRHRCRVLATMSNKIGSFRQSRNKLNMFNLSKGRNFVQHCGQNDNVVAKNVNYVEATFDFVEKKLNFTINSVDIVAVFGSKVERWLLRHCCWCGRSFSGRHQTASPTPTDNISKRRRRHRRGFRVHNTPDH